MAMALMAAETIIPTVKLGNLYLGPTNNQRKPVKHSILGNVPAGTYALTIVYGPFTLTAAANFNVNGPSPTGFSPSSGAINTAVNITGHFLPDTYYDVSFGSMPTDFYSASATTLHVYVPYGVPVGKHKVTIHFANVDVVLPGTFEAIGPEITSFNPVSSIPGSVFTISGCGFSPDTWSAKVRFSTVEAPTITSLTETPDKSTRPLWH